jgi:lipopolysaccharide biosynthesis glycosyltransferase
MKKHIQIAVASDYDALPGLYVTLFSLLESNSSHLFEIHLVYENLAPAHFRAIEQIIYQANRGNRFHRIPISSRRFSQLHGLHGNRMTYCRLLLAELLPEQDRVLYLDSDLIVRTEIDAIWEWPMASLIGAVPIGVVAYSAVEAKLLNELGVPGDAPYFNAGILLIDLAGWREQAISARLLDIARVSGERLAQHDQTVLNLFFNATFDPLPARFNIIALPTSVLPEAAPEGIIHFVGSPKPWDPFGKQFNRSAAVYYDTLRRLKASQQLNVLPRLARLFKVWRSYVRIAIECLH